MNYIMLILFAIQFWIVIWIVCEMVAIKRDIKIIILNSHRDRNIIIETVKGK